MSYLKSPHYASVTTRLLAEIDDRMPPRQRIVAAGLILFLTIGSIASSRPAERPAQLVQPIILIATPTLPAARGLVKEAAPQSAVSVLAAPTVAPTPAPVVEQVQVVVVQPARQVHERPSDKAPPR